MSTETFEIFTSEDVLWQGKTPFRNSEYRIIRVSDEDCFVQEYLPSYSWTSEVSDGVCAEVYMTAFLSERNAVNKFRKSPI